MKITFSVPGVPTGKKRPRFARRGRHVVAYQDRDDARRENLVALAYREAAGNAAPHSGPVVIVVEAVFVPPQSWSNKRKADPGHKVTKPDLDNVVKSVCDGLNGLAFADDSQIVRMKAGKRFGGGMRLLSPSRGFDHDGHPPTGQGRPFPSPQTHFDGQRGPKGGRRIFCRKSP